MLTLDWIMLVGCTWWALWQYRRTKILLTPSNAFLIGTIILPVFVAYLLALSPESLAAIGQSGHALSMQWAADELLGVICVGTICALGCPAPVPASGRKPARTAPLASCFPAPTHYGSLRRLPVRSRQRVALLYQRMADSSPELSTSCPRTSRNEPSPAIYLHRRFYPR